MANKENILDQIVDALRNSATEYFPGHSAVKAARVVGHTPKTDHYTYEIVLEFAAASERVNAKVYRAGKAAGHAPQELARDESENLKFAWAAAEKNGLSGVPRPVGEFSSLGAVVCTKIDGLPLQSVIMKTALLPDFGNDGDGLLELGARQAGEWLQRFHKATAAPDFPLDAGALLADLEQVCARATKKGLPAESTEAVLRNARAMLNRQSKPLLSSAVLNDFVPLDVLVGDSGVGFCEFAHLRQNGSSLYDVAVFLAAVEALEKYPFCNRSITTLVQDAFLEAYGVGEEEQELLTVLKMKVLLEMFAQGRTGRESAERKKIMWANVMKRFIQQAAQRSLISAA